MKMNAKIINLYELCGYYGFIQWLLDNKSNLDKDLYPLGRVSTLLDRQYFFGHSPDKTLSKLAQHYFDECTKGKFIVNDDRVLVLDDDGNYVTYTPDTQETIENLWEIIYETYYDKWRLILDKLYYIISSQENQWFDYWEYQTNEGEIKDSGSVSGKTSGTTTGTSDETTSESTTKAGTESKNDVDKIENTWTWEVEKYDESNSSSDTSTSQDATNAFFLAEASNTQNTDSNNSSKSHSDSKEYEHTKNTDTYKTETHTITGETGETDTTSGSTEGNTSTTTSGTSSSTNDNDRTSEFTTERKGLSGRKTPAEMAEDIIQFMNKYNLPNLIMMDLDAILASPYYLL